MIKQLIRQQTFETNSSSMHTLTIIDKQLFDDFKGKKIFYNPHKGFISYQDIPTLSEFQVEFPTFNQEEQSVKDYMIKTFIQDFFDTDYGVGYTLGYIDAEYETVFDKDGNEKIALSLYIGDC